MVYKGLFKMFLVLMLVLFSLKIFGQVGSENIDPNNDGSQYAYGENIGWLNFEPAQGPGVTVTDTAVTGFAWSENIGWINLSPTNGGVVNDTAGNLSGFAWAENGGWISFSGVNYGVVIDTNTGKFSGFAWGENIGWISFSCENTNSCMTGVAFGVTTAWRPFVDTDADGISNTLDLQPNTPSVDFNDNASPTPTSGTIISGNLTIRDHEDPAQGVRITTGSSGGVTRTLLSNFRDSGQGQRAALPSGVAVEASGDILVISPTVAFAAGAIRGGLFRVDPSTGSRTLLSFFGNSSQGPLGGFPFKVAVTPFPPGDIVVLDSSAGTTGAAALFNVDPSTGSRTLISDFGNSNGPLLTFVTNVAVEASGDILVIGISAGTTPRSGLFRVNPSTGFRTLLSNFSDMPVGFGPSDLAVEASDDILVIDSSSRLLFRADPVSGVRVVLSDFNDIGGHLPFPNIVAVAPSGDILVIDVNGGTDGIGDLLRVDPSIGVRTFLSDLGDPAEGIVLLSPFDMAVEALGGILVIDRSVSIGPGTSFGGALFRLTPSGVVSVCGGAAIISLFAGDEVVVTCSSVMEEVVSGTDVGTMFVGIDGTTGFVSMSAPNILTFDPGTFTFTADAFNPDNIEIDVDGFVVVLPPGEQVTLRPNIDIQPGTGPNNRINLKSKGDIPVAILSTADFDATMVDPDTVEFGPAGASKVHRRGHTEDVDGDGILDLVLHFRTQETGIVCGDTMASLTGMTFDGTIIMGSNSIVTKGCK